MLRDLDRLPFGLKRKHVAAIGDAKSPEVRHRRIHKLVTSMNSDSACPISRSAGAAGSDASGVQPDPLAATAQRPADVENAKQQHHPGRPGRRRVSAGPRWAEA